MTENVFMPKKEPNVALFTFFMILVIFFTTSDLVANCLEENICASIFSILSGFFVFLGTALKKTQNIQKGINTKIDYLNSNFSCGMVILSILDIICSLIAVFTTVLALAAVFRSLFALRLIVTLNKVKTVTQSILLFVVGYLCIRFKTIKKRLKELKMKSFLKKIWAGIKSGLKFIFVTNPQATGATIVNAFASAFLGFSVTVEQLGINLPTIMIGTFDIVPVIVSIVAFALVEVLGIKWAFETNTVADARKAEEQAEKEKAAEAKKAVKLFEEAEAKRIAEEKAALALVEAKAKEEAEAQAKAEQEAIAKAEEERLLELGRKLLAEEQAKKAVEAQVQEVVVVEDKPEQNQ